MSGGRRGTHVIGSGGGTDEAPRVRIVQTRRSADLARAVRSGVETYRVYLGAVLAVFTEGVQPRTRGRGRMNTARGAGIEVPAPLCAVHRANPFAITWQTVAYSWRTCRPEMATVISCSRRCCRSPRRRSRSRPGASW